MRERYLAKKEEKAAAGAGADTVQRQKHSYTPPAKNEPSCMYACLHFWGFVAIAVLIFYLSHQRARSLGEQPPFKLITLYANGELLSAEPREAHNVTMVTFPQALRTFAGSMAHARVPRAFADDGQHRNGYSKVVEGEALWVVPDNHHFVWPAIAQQPKMHWKAHPHGTGVRAAHSSAIY